MTKTLGFIAILGALSLEGHAATPPGAVACSQTTEDALRSCRSGAQSDFWLALGTCANVSQRAARKDCEKQAAADQKDAFANCDAQHVARQAVCRRLGGAAYDPEIDPPDFVVGVDNPFFPLRPGTTLVYEGQAPEGRERDTFVVTHGTRVIAGVTCVEVHDVVTLHDVLVEDTLDWFAQDRDGNVWYFGENAKQLEGGLVVGIEGSWAAGVDGAKPGIIMRARPRVDDFYRQEFLLGTAEDLGAVLGLDESVTVPFGAFGSCIETEDTSPLDPESVEQKFYAPGIGNVLEVDLVTGERLELVQVTTE